MKRLAIWAETAYKRIDGISGGRVELVRQVLERFTEARAAQGAAAMAYYAVFSLFPLLLVLVAALGYWMTDQEAMQQAAELRLSSRAVTPACSPWPLRCARRSKPDPRLGANSISPLFPASPPCLRWPRGLVRLSATISARCRCQII